MKESQDLPKEVTRWNSFGLRQLLLLITVVAVGLSLLFRQTEKQRAVNALQRVGQVEFQGISAGWGEAVLGTAAFRDVVDVKCEGEQVEDRYISYLAQLPSIKDLSLAGSTVSDIGMSGISQLHLLKRLDLSKTKVSDDALKHLTNLQQLCEVDLSETHVGKEQLVALPQLRQLLTLSLAANDIDDDDVARLSDLEPGDKTRFG
jgi:Leucine-rich repeat (LRR) protein